MMAGRRRFVGNVLSDVGNGCSQNQLRRRFPARGPRPGCGVYPGGEAELSAGGE